MPLISSDLRPMANKGYYPLVVIQMAFSGHLDIKPGE